MERPHLYQRKANVTHVSAEEKIYALESLNGCIVLATGTEILA